MKVTKHQHAASKPKPWHLPKQMYSFLGIFALITHVQAHSAPQEFSTGFAPFASATHTYDSNLLNRSKSGTGPAPQSDQIDRVEIGTQINFQLSRQKFSGELSLSETRHAQFKNRDTEGRAHRLRWDSEIGKTLVVAAEGSSTSDQAPIQTGLVSAIKRDQDNLNASITWNLHPNYSVLNQVSKTNTRFSGSENTNDAVLSGLNRDDELTSIGVEYHPGTGSSIALLSKQSNGHFPIRQIISPGQSVSNDFDQKETELLGKWNYSDITALTLSLSSVQRNHDEIQARDFSGTNYRIEILYNPTVKTNFNLSWGKQIVGISDATNSDALARQLFLRMNMQVTDKVLLRLAYRPQDLEFSGIDGLSASPRNERVKESSASMEYQLYERVALGTSFQMRDRTSTLDNADYSANSASFFVKYHY